MANLAQRIGQEFKTLRDNELAPLSTNVSNIIASMSTDTERLAAIADLTTAFESGDADLLTAMSNKLDNTHNMSLTLTGDVSGLATFTGMGDASMTVTIADDSHNHTVSNIDGLQSAIDQAELDAVSTANTFTTTRESAITAAYQAYADQSEVDAKAYTDGRETAITTAYQSYADAAETAAISSSNAYTDGRETAITTAYQSYADQSEVDAKAYTDTRETAITTAYQAYADQSEVDAKAYTDSEIAGLIDSAPGALDTLNELAAAMGDDANFAASTTNAIATAKSEAISSSNGYTDTREAAITAAYQSYADAAGNIYYAGSNLSLDGTTFNVSASPTFSGTVTASDFNSTSDERLKTNVETIANAGEKVAALRGVNYDWIANGEKTMGVIAQEVEAVIPEVVATDDEGMKSVNYQAMVGLLIEAVKDLQAQVDALK